MNKIKNIAVVAHVDAGKTTLLEQVLFLTGAIRVQGNVNKGSTHLDWNEIERNRGITVFSEQASVNWKDVGLNFIDTPGHKDFSSELERAFEAVDGVIILVSAVEGVQQHTETVWKLAMKYEKPVIFFINKIDRIGASLEITFKDIKNKLTSDLILLQTTDKQEKDFWAVRDILKSKKYIYSETGEEKEERNKEDQEKRFLIEKLAEIDEELLEKYFSEEKVTEDDLLKTLYKNTCLRKVYPVIIGSAARGIGISALLDYTVELMPFSKKNSRAIFACKIFKLKHDEQMGQLAYVKVLSGDVKIRDSIYGMDQKENKITQIRKYTGEKYISLDILESGDIGVLCGLKDVRAGDMLFGTANDNNGRINKSIKEQLLIPLLVTKIRYKEEDLQALFNAVKILDDEDPLLNYQWDQNTKEASISIMGLVQMEVLEEVFRIRFGLKIKFEEPTVNYYETVTGLSFGFCHFEPKKHYAEVEVEITPNESGEGIMYESQLSTDVLPLQYQNAIKKAVPEALERGALAGCPVKDVIVKLLRGKYHLEHTHGGDFRLATIRAVQQALENNNTILLEPIVEFVIVSEKDLSGKIMSDILKMEGNFVEPVIDGNKIIITGQVPVSTSVHYPLELSSYSGGRASISMRYFGLQRCHNEELVLQEMDERLASEEHDSENKDILYNSVSLFRAKRKMKKVKNN